MSAVTQCMLIFTCRKLVSKGNVYRLQPRKLCIGEIIKGVPPCVCYTSIDLPVCDLSTSAIGRCQHLQVYLYIPTHFSLLLDMGP